MVLAGSRENRAPAAVSGWMRQHLSVVVVPYPHRDSLAAIEEAVLTSLDPPLNLMGMPDSDIRRSLRQLRRSLSARGNESADPSERRSVHPVWGLIFAVCVCAHQVNWTNRARADSP